MGRVATFGQQEPNIYDRMGCHGTSSIKHRGYSHLRHRKSAMEARRAVMTTQGGSPSCLRIPGLWLGGRVCFVCFAAVVPVVVAPVGENYI